ncbi:GspE/PulE family protein [Chromobacterium sp. IIBBL 290-4]|uniref:GspE/PulE family protein n=1 Tax=Chromobacterium sp. IIBBL 290-4 TaxID=2953890 RepID=UPI0020B8A053|nr:ATPase, T2SS/T4P/T4SS family [Chromobacterium sp. IIBBL 290-4]UTH74135.1 Flp pilus assembly complex ATPase component TadA [Chromobacterium sp. IIBBL 290-4]
MLKTDAIRQHGWRIESDLLLPGYENSVLVLGSAKTKQYILLIDEASYPQLRQGDLLQRFDSGIRARARLSCFGVFVGAMDEILLVQSQLQQQAGEGDARAGDARNGGARNFDMVLEKAIELKATDIHFEFRDGAQVRVRYRIHGKLRDSDPKERLLNDFNAMMDAVSTAYNSRADSSSRSHNHFDENRHQSCSISLNAQGRNYQLRFQSVKENRGVDVILRVLLNEAVEKDILSLQELGYSEDQVEVLEDAVYRSPGLTIIAGETGSGKTTTLRTLMTYERDSGKKFFSIEDPVEYIQPHVTQIPIQRKAEDGKKEGSETPFGAAAKVLLRGDPDKVMGGEIRDAETGAFAKAMTQTGHQVLSTVHASSGFGVLARLSENEIGIPVHSLASPDFLTVLVYQKLLPVLCPDCSRMAVEVLSDDYLMVIASLGIDIGEVRVEGEGCPQCRYLGTAGQTVVAEVCEISEEMLPMIREGRFWEAERYWRAKSNGKLYDQAMLGKTAMEHAIYKMSLGLLDPRDVESAFRKLKKYRPLSLAD